MVPFAAPSPWRCVMYLAIDERRPLLVHAVPGHFRGRPRWIWPPAQWQRPESPWSELLRHRQSVGDAVAEHVLMIGGCCAWCGLAIRLGIVTRGGVVWHLACWRAREQLLRAFGAWYARRRHGRAPLRAVFPCPLCQEHGRVVPLEAQLERDEELLVVTEVAGCQHADGFGDPGVLTLAEEWRLIEAALAAVEGATGRSVGA